jgi:hypothetical protein
MLSLRTATSSAKGAKGLATLAIAIVVGAGLVPTAHADPKVADHPQCVDNSGGLPSAGEQVTCRYMVENRDDVPYKNITVTLGLPRSNSDPKTTRFVSSNGTFDGDKAVFRRDVLNPSEVFLATLVFTVKANTPAGTRLNAMGGYGFTRLNGTVGGIDGGYTVVVSARE